jgi:hypothetical protein
MNTIRYSSLASLKATVVQTLLLSHCAWALTIVADGKSNYSIVIPDEPIPAETTAAEELALHVEQISGARLPIVSESEFSDDLGIFLGPTRRLTELGVEPDWEELGDEGYYLRTIDRQLIIAGGRPRGTLYGVYDVLQEQWGCRWYTFDTSYIPNSKSLPLPDLDIVKRPVFEFRVIQFGYHNPWFWEQFEQSYAARLRWNYAHRSEDDPTWGGEFRMRPGVSHNYAYFVDPAKYGKDHPEYYALHEGERLNYVLPTNDVELCLSNPGTADAVIKNAAKHLRETPDVDMVFIGQSDTMRYCKCDNCDAARTKYGGWDSARRVQIPGNLPDRTRPDTPQQRVRVSFWHDFGGFAGLQVEFLNKIAAGLENEFPNVFIGSYAFYYNRQPPRGIKAHKNVMMMYAPWSRADGKKPRCYCHSIDSGPINDRFSNFSAELGSWTRISQKMYVYDYWLSGWYGQPVNINTMRRTIRFYRKLGVEGVWLCYTHGIPAGFEWLTFWLWSQLAWDPDFDEKRGIEEFCDAYYGAAGPHIRQYIELASNPKSYAMDPRPDILGTRLGGGTAIFTDDPYRPVEYDDLRSCQLHERMLTIDAINEGYEIFEQARRAVAGDSKAAKHVEYTRMVLQNAMLEWLPGNDPRLNGEIEPLIELAKELQLEKIGFWHLTHDEYREWIREKIESGALLHTPKKDRDRHAD